MSGSILREVYGALCCCLPLPSESVGPSRDLKRLSDWRGHPTLRQYDLVEHVADGGFSEIWLARQRSTGEHACIKAVYLRKPGLRPEDAAVLRAEARFLRNLEHPALLRCRDAFETKFHLVMVLEYLSGGEMLHHLHRVEHYSETEAARLFAQVASAVSYLHNLNIVHRDIKPENVMFVRPVDEALASGAQLRVKLIDLGMAAVLLAPPPPQHDQHAQEQQHDLGHGDEPGRQGRGGGGPAACGASSRRPLLGRPGPLWEARGEGRRGKGARARSPPRGCLGSPGFIAPEVVSGAPHSFAMDVYSLGVLLFVMLTGRKPWPLREVRSLEYARRPIAGAPGLKDASFMSLSPAARSLLVAMLADDPRDRPTAGQVLRHEFVAAALRAGRPGAAPLGRPLDDAIKRRMSQLASLRRFRGLAFAMMSIRGEGQRQSDFVAQVAARRSELHRDLLVRAKTRHAAAQAAAHDHRQHLKQRSRQQQQQQHEEEGEGEPQRPGQHPRPASPAASTRPSADSTSSQRPLLRSPPRSCHDQWRRHSGSPAGHGSSRRWSADEQQRLAHQHHQPLQPSPLAAAAAARAQRHSLDSAARPAAGASPVAACTAAAQRESGCGLTGGRPHAAPLVDHSPRQRRPQHLATVPEPQAARDRPAAAARAAAANAPSRPPLPPQNGRASAAAAGRLSSHCPPAAAAAATAAAAVATQGSPHRGWSSSGRREDGAAAASRANGAAAGRPRRRHPESAPAQGLHAHTHTHTRGKRRAHNSELELAALDPLALIRELPVQHNAGPERPAGQDPGPPGQSRCGMLGRVHSAPESAIAAAAGAGLDLPAGKAGPAGSPGRGMAEEAGGGPATAWLEGLGMGADMRAFSANSWTLDLLANADLLAALTGMDLALAPDASQRGTSSAGDGASAGGTVYGGGLYGVASNLSCAIDSALAGDGGSVDLGGPSGGGSMHGGGGAAAAAVAAVWRQLPPGLSGAVSAALSDGTVHAASQAAAALLAAAAADGAPSGGAPVGSGRRSREGWSQPAFAAALAALGGAGSGAGSALHPSSRLQPAGGRGALLAADTPTHSLDTSARLAGAAAGALGASPFSAAVAAECPCPTYPRVLFRASPSSSSRAPAPSSSTRFSGAGAGVEPFGAVALRPVGASAVEGGGGLRVGDTGLYTTPSDAMPPLQLFRALRAGDRDNMGLLLPPFNSPHASHQIAASPASLGVALPAAAAGMQPRGAAAAATSFASASTLPSPSPMKRPPPLAIVHLEDHVAAAQRASFEETLHGGNLWFQSVAAADAAAADADRQGSRGAVGPPADAGSRPGAVGVPHGAGRAVEPAGLAARAGSASRPGMTSVPEGPVRAGAVTAKGSGISGGCSEAGLGASAAAAAGGALGAAPASTRWRSPFEALAHAPLGSGGPL